MTKSTLVPDDEAAGLADIRDLIAFKLARVATLNDRIGQRLFSQQMSLSLREFRTLATIGYLGMASASLLAEESFLDKAQMSRIISVLVAKDLVERVGSRGRGGVLQLSAAGRELLADGLAFATRQNNLLVAGMPEQDLTRLMQLVDDLLVLANQRYHELQDEGAFGQAGPKQQSRLTNRGQEYGRSGL